MKREWEYECSIWSPLDQEGKIHSALVRRMPELAWDEGDSNWDKVRVWGNSDLVNVRLYRYESPGPFALTIRVKAESEGEAERTLAVIRDKVLAALQATVEPKT